MQNTAFKTLTTGFFRSPELTKTCQKLVTVHISLSTKWLLLSITFSYVLQDKRSICGKGRDFYVPQRLRPPAQSTQQPNQWIPEALPQLGKQPKREAADARNAWNYIYTPHTSLRRLCLIKQADNFAFTGQIGDFPLTYWFWNEN